MDISRDRSYLINVLRGKGAAAEQASLLAPAITVDTGGMAATTLVTIYSERLVPDGVATSFTLANSYRPASIRLYVDGLRYTPGGSYDYTETGPNTIAFVSAPPATSNLLVDYDKL